MSRPSRQRRADSNKQSALQQLQEAKQHGKRRLDQLDLSDEDDVYYDADDPKAEEVIAKRRAERGFVVDDSGRGGLGYAEDADDDSWIEKDVDDYQGSEDESRGHASSVITGMPARSKPKKKKSAPAKATEIAPDKNQSKLSSSFLRGVAVGGGGSAAGAGKPKSLTSRAHIARDPAADEDFLNSLLGDMDSAVAAEPSTRPKHAAKKPAKSSSKSTPRVSSVKVESDAMDMDSDAMRPVGPAASREHPVSLTAGGQPVLTSAVAANRAADAVSSQASSVAVEELGFDIPADAFDDPFLPPSNGTSSSPSPAAGTALQTHSDAGGHALSPDGATPTKLKPLGVGDMDWRQDTDGIVADDGKAAAPAPAGPGLAGAGSGPGPIAADGSLLLYWIDAFEVPFDRSGKLYLFGRALVNSGDDSPSTPANTVTCCIVVSNLERNVLLLPREYAVLDPRKPQETRTDKKVSLVDVYTELKELADRAGVKKFKTKRVERKYCFDAKKDGVPDQGEYMKVVYPAASPPFLMPTEQGGTVACGKTFSHAFGSQASPLELFLLKRDLMGPCWLRVTGVSQSTSPVSWCRYEYNVEDPKTIVVVPDAQALPAPSLSVLSLSLKTVLNTKNHSHEIVMISGLMHRAVSVEGPTDKEKQLEHFTAMCPPKGQTWPFGLQDTIKAKKLKNTALVHEAALLNFLMAKLHYLDPDVIVGHGLHGFPIEVLLHRLHHHKIKDWSKLGRLKRSVMPIRRGGFSVVDQGVCAGRLLCDTEVTAKELIGGETSYDLTHLAQSQLGRHRHQVEINEMPQRLSDNQEILALCAHTEQDAFLALGLMFKLVILPLTRQLTCLCGNLWKNTLRAQRADRVAFLLLHEFHRLKYIAPEKTSSKDREARKEREASKAATKSGKGKGKTKGKAKTKSEDKENPAAVHMKGEDGGDSNHAPVLGTAESGHADEPDIEAEDEPDEEHVDDDAQMGGTGRKKRKPQYRGGFVLEPVIGFYDKFVVILDFNSLYPSIIREYNLCFTTLQHWNVTGPDAVPQLPDSSLPQGVLPTVVKRLLERRREVKKQMKTERSEAKQKQLDIRQKALKLVANSMYGCLGFESSRFYCKPLASLITTQGREILQRTKDTAERIGFTVIYGDTDSIMISTGTDDLVKAKEVGNTLKKEVNKQYKVLEIDIDGIFKTLLLLRKKKYAVLKVVEKPGEKTFTAVREIKGIDMVRRDWSELSKDSSSFVLDQLLSGNARDEVIEAIHSHLRKIAADVRANRIALNKYIVIKGLTKSVQDYPNPKAQPHVQVALWMMAQGRAVRVGDHIPYIVCEDPRITEAREKAGLPIDQPVNLGITELPMAERSYHPDAIVKSNGKLRVDVNWYLSNQVLPVVARLLIPIPETNSSLIAECLGLDGTKFAHFSVDDKGTAAAEAQAELLASENDEERYEHAEKLFVTCPRCQVRFEFSGVFKLDGDGACGFACPSPECINKGLILEMDDLHHILNAVDIAIRQKLVLYYDRWRVCSDPGCQHRTKQPSIRGIMCVMPGCRGQLHPEYTDEMLYNQIMYFSNLFEVPRWVQRVEHENKRRRESQQAALATKLSDLHVQAFDVLHRHVREYLFKNKRFFVQLRKVFARVHS